MKIYFSILIMISLVTCLPCFSQRYQPDGDDFVIINGKKRFNRALYGTNTGFRIEAGDLPEFALYMPGMGGNLKFGLVKPNSDKWLIESDHIKARYRPGSMIYEIRDTFLGNGILHLYAIAMSDAEGVILKLVADDISEGCQLFWAFGGATGKRFSREGDIGADPESVFYLKPDYCSDNEYVIRNNLFRLYYGSGRARSEDELYENNYQLTDREKEALRLKSKKKLNGLVPVHSTMKICDARKQDSPLAFQNSDVSETPAITGILNINPGDEIYYIIWNPDTKDTLQYADAQKLFNDAEISRKKLAGRIRVITPDPYINAIGGALSIAADAIWEEPSYLHGAVAWRMRLPGWRGAYTADWLGWHDRARMHFSAYLKSQYTSPDSGPTVPDPKTNYARQEEKAGIAIFTNGYISRHPGRISRPHHYDMNLIFFDQLLWHLKWTGDTTFACDIWPSLQRHLAWEKRCFDGNNDGLYDAYCCIWASDALQYSGGGTTHSSSYNYRANRIAAEIADLIGEDPGSYVREAEKIQDAVNSMLWLPDKGWYAEYKDLLGLQKVHPAAALWTIYHAIDSDIPDAFQTYQLLKYVDNEIPHIPVVMDDQPHEKYQILSTTSWMPYTWSINNVSLAENLHTALAYWQGGRKEEAFRLWKSAVLESMYMGASPGNFQQLSGHDAFRGELYRDFADPIGIASRTLVEGLFGIHPDALQDTLTICQGFPMDWDYASLTAPDISLDYKRQNDTEVFTIKPSFPKKMNLKLKISARGDWIESVLVNGKKNNWQVVKETIGNPYIEIIAGYAPEYLISVSWKGDFPEDFSSSATMAFNQELDIRTDRAVIEQIYDPQQILHHTSITSHHIQTGLNEITGHHTFFIRLNQSAFNWWEPYCVELVKPVEIIADLQQKANELKFQIRNNTDTSISTRFVVNPGLNCFTENEEIPPSGTSSLISVPRESIIPGSNRVTIESDSRSYQHHIVNWEVDKKGDHLFTTIDLEGYFNDVVENIFKNQYLSPRSPYPTLQLPLQGIGDWCSYRETAEIDDTGLRKMAGHENMIYLPQGIPFATPGEGNKPNILFTSLWDNYPDNVTIPLSGKASHVYLLMAGSTHHMQSRFTNGRILIIYADGASERLELRNPENWWPIEQDYYTDGMAFTVNATRPLRVHLKTGEVTLEPYQVLSRNKTIHIEGGAASVLDLPLDSSKPLRELRLETTANDVVIGLMGITLAAE